MIERLRLERDCVQVLFVTARAARMHPGLATSKAERVDICRKPASPSRVIWRYQWQRSNEIQFNDAPVHHGFCYPGLQRVPCFCEAQ